MGDRDRDIRNKENTGEITRQIDVTESPPRVAELSPGTQGQEVMTESLDDDLRMKIDKELEKLKGIEIGTRSMKKIIFRFESKLEAAVQRMARLGTIEEEDEETVVSQRVTELGLSLANVERVQYCDDEAEDKEYGMIIGGPVTKMGQMMMILSWS